MSQWSTLRERSTGKWQIPLLVFSVIFLGGSFLRIQPDPARLSPDEALETLDRLIARGLAGRAIELAEILLAEGGPTAASLAPVHLRLARALFRGARDEGIKSPRAGRRITESYQHAAEHGLKLTADDLEHLGQAFEWQGQVDPALSCYTRAIDGGIEHRGDLRRRLIWLTLRRPEALPEHVNEMLDVLLAEVEGHRLDLRLWAIEQKIHVLEELDRLAEAATLLARNRDRFQGSDLQNHFDYLEALYLYKKGRYEQADKFLRALRNRLDSFDELHAMTGWLLGRVVLSDGGPQRPAEAMSFFSDVIAYHPESVYAVASRVGLAESLALLELHDEALDAFRVAVDRLQAFSDQRVVNREVLRASLGVTAEAQRQAGRFGAAMGYAQLATTLVDRENTEQTTLFLQQLAQVQALRAEELKGHAEALRAAEDITAGAVRQRAWDMYAAAAETSLQIARINVLNDRLSADWSWRAAEFYGEADQGGRSVELYREYVRERPGHALVPRALLRIGQHCHATGRLPEAIEAYQHCYRNFPRTLDGARALVPLARAYLAEGPGHEELAEKTLRVILEDSEVFTPQAPEFADALFILGDVLNRRGAFERAIATLEEALERYPDDPRVWRTRFLLADSYRQSAWGLKQEMAEAAFGSELQQMQTESILRFNRARELYRGLITEYEVRGLAGLNRLEQVYFRHASLYQADCYFETRDYGPALKLYEEAASTFKDSPTALAAYVQIINCHVFLGEPQEARAALARALILVDAIRQPAFHRSVSPETQSDWRRYFEWLGDSELF